MRLEHPLLIHILISLIVSLPGRLVRRGVESSDVFDIEGFKILLVRAYLYMMSRDHTIIRLLGAFERECVVLIPLSRLHLAAHNRVFSDRVDRAVKLVLVRVTHGTGHLLALGPS